MSRPDEEPVATRYMSGSDEVPDEEPKLPVTYPVLMGFLAGNQRALLQSHHELVLTPHPTGKKICAICLDKVRRGQGQAIFTAECSHSFHFNCIVVNVDHGNLVCPICRSKWKDVPFRAPSSSNNNGAGGSRGVVVNVVPLPLPLDDFSDDEPLPRAPISPTSGPQGLTLTTFTEFPAVAASKSPAAFSLVVSIRAPPLHVDDDARAPIDLVAVLDVSSSMVGAKLSLLKRAVYFVIHSLTSSDRLSIVAFSSRARRILPLRRMSDTGRADAVQAIDSLASNGGTDIVGGLTNGARVLEERREQNAVAAIILLSDGKDNYNNTNSNILLLSSSQAGKSNPPPEYLKELPASINNNNNNNNHSLQQATIPVHTFGFGLDHDSTAMHAISDASAGGTFSFVESIVMIQDAFARCIGGLLSVVAQEVRVMVKTASPGLRIGSIHSGSYVSKIFSDEGQQQGVIEVENLYAEEDKQFLVDLSNIPPAGLCCTSTSSNCESKEREENQKTALLDVVCSYKDSVSSEELEVQGERVYVGRPQNLCPTDLVVSVEIDRQRNRIMVAEGIREAQVMAEAGNLEGAQASLAEARASLLSSASAQAGDCLCNRLEAELREIRERMTSQELYRQSGRAFVLSGLSSHSLQRTTTRGDENSLVGFGFGYDTPTMVSMVTKSQQLTN
ncbi:E3 ubiquitin-protein ligase WAV3-like [Corylus avellana]|uniref:E3 ubiquitin-protein ligase WAV3-like n=1 Tax=Corylus avellana TaxID=13451 RepID=UPI00286B5051|nr:E3 ubiquitin-protein ligase WAV3-like [Corylus avellana]